MIAFLLGGTPARNFDDPAGPRFLGEAPRAGAPRHPAGAVTVATYNLMHGDRLPAAMEVIARTPQLASADIVAVQEADERAMATLAARFGWHYVYYPSAVHPLSGRNFGPGLLSPWPLQADRKLPLPHLGRRRGLRRIAVRALATVGGTTVAAWAVHLGTMFELSFAQQAEQARVVAVEAAAEAGPVVVAGDLNRRGVAREFAAAGFDWPTRHVGATHLVWSFDHVFIRGRPGPARAGRVRHPANPSDHLPVWAELRA